MMTIKKSPFRVGRDQNGSCEAERPFLHSTRRRVHFRALPLLLAVGLAWTVGCHAVNRDRYFLQSSSKPGEEPNYYRVTVRGRAVASQARYVSGFFDEKAVEEYFGEFSQPKGGKFFTESEPVDDEPIDPRLEHRSLVLLLSANSDAVAGQIGALAENEQVMDALGGLLGKDLTAKLSERIFQLNELEVRTKTFAADANARLTSGTISPQELLILGNQLASVLGATEEFSDIASLRNWLDTQRNSLLAEGK